MTRRPTCTQAKDHCGFTPLHATAWRMNSAATGALLAAGASSAAADRQGCQPLHLLTARPRDVPLADAYNNAAGHVPADARCAVRLLAHSGRRRMSWTIGVALALKRGKHTTHQRLLLLSSAAQGSQSPCPVMVIADVA